MSDIAVIKNHQVATQRHYDPKQLQLIQRTVAKDTTVDEFNMFIEICKRQGLDPIRRQIYALVFNKDKPAKRQVAFITGIDGYRAMAARSGMYRPDENPPEFVTDPAAKCPNSNPMGIISCTVRCHKYGMDGKWYPIAGTAYWTEFAPISERGSFQELKDESGNPILQTDGPYAGKAQKGFVGNGQKYLAKDNWKTMPYVMIAKCAEVQALRRGWPEDLGGLYIQEEMDRKATEIQTASELVEEFEQQERLARVGAVSSIPLMIGMTEGMKMVPQDKFADVVLATLRGFVDKPSIDLWLDQNKSPLQQFWAYSKGDALALKVEIDKLIAALPIDQEVVA